MAVDALGASLGPRASKLREALTEIDRRGRPDSPHDFPVALGRGDICSGRTCGLILQKDRHRVSEFGSADWLGFCCREITQFVTTPLAHHGIGKACERLRQMDSEWREPQCSII